MVMVTLITITTDSVGEELILVFEISHWDSIQFCRIQAESDTPPVIQLCESSSQHRSTARYFRSCLKILVGNPLRYLLALDKQPS